MASGSGRSHDATPSDFAYYLQDLSDEDLADLYAMYIDATNTAWFSDIFWEANRRGLTLDDLEGIHARNNPPLYDPPCSLDS